MSNHDEFPWGTVIFVALLFVFLVWSWRSDFQDCMRKKHDEILCHIYARPR